MDGVLRAPSHYVVHVLLMAVDVPILGSRVDKGAVTGGGQSLRFLDFLADCFCVLSVPAGKNKNSFFTMLIEIWSPFIIIPFKF